MHISGNHLGSSNAVCRSLGCLADHGLKLTSSHLLYWCEEQGQGLIVGALRCTNLCTQQVDTSLIQRISQSMGKIFFVRAKTIKIFGFCPFKEKCQDTDNGLSGDAEKRAQEVRNNTGDFASLSWLLLLRSTGSRHAGFSSCDSWALERRLSSCGTQA